MREHWHGEPQLSGHNPALNRGWDCRESEASSRIQAAQPSEIQLRLEELEKALRALGEEVDELEGVLHPVLAAEPASTQGASASQASETDLGQRLHSLLDLARKADHSLRSMRARCRL